MFALSETYDHRDTQYLTNKGWVLSDSARVYSHHFVDVGAHCLEKR
jgi:hypothetical protein